MEKTRKRRVPEGWNLCDKVEYDGEIETILGFSISGANCIITRKKGNPLKGSYSGYKYNEYGESIPIFDENHKVWAISLRELKKVTSVPDPLSNPIEKEILTKKFDNKGFKLNQTVTTVDGDEVTIEGFCPGDDDWGVRVIVNGRGKGHKGDRHPRYHFDENRNPIAFRPTGSNYWCYSIDHIKPIEKTMTTPVTAPIMEPYPTDKPYIKIKATKEVNLPIWPALPVLPVGYESWCFSDTGSWLPECNRWGANIPKEYFEVVEKVNLTAPIKKEEKMTMEEIQAECEKRFPIGCTFINTKSEKHTLKKDSAVYSIMGLNIWASSGQGCLYEDGKWATLVSMPEPSKKEFTMDYKPTLENSTSGERIAFFRKYYPTGTKVYTFYGDTSFEGDIVKVLDSNNIGEGYYRLWSGIGFIFINNKWATRVQDEVQSIKPTEPVVNSFVKNSFIVPTYLEQKSEFFETEYVYQLKEDAKVDSFRVNKDLDEDSNSYNGSYALRMATNKEIDAYLANKNSPVNVNKLADLLDETKSDLHAGYIGNTPFTHSSQESKEAAARFLKDDSPIKSILEPEIIPIKVPVFKKKKKQLVFRECTNS